MRGIKGMMKESREIKEFIMQEKDFIQQSAEIEESVDKMAEEAAEKKDLKRCLIIDACFAIIQDTIGEAHKLLEEGEVDEDK